MASSRASARAIAEPRRSNYPVQLTFMGPPGIYKRRRGDHVWPTRGGQSTIVYAIYRVIAESPKTPVYVTILSSRERSSGYSRVYGDEDRLLSLRSSGVPASGH